MSRYLKIDSAMRMNPLTTSPGQFTVQLQSSITGRWALKQAYAIASNYNISDTNNVIAFYENAVLKTATLTSGYYNVNQLLAELASQLTAASGGYATYTVTQSLLPQRITIASTQNFELRFGSSPDRSAAEILGFPPVDTASATSQLASSAPNLATIRSYNIQVNDTTGFVDTRGRSSSLVIPILGNSQSLCIYEPTETFPQVLDFHQHVSVLTVKVSDDSGNVLGLTADWYMILCKE
jgi:hypothetical protein